MSTETFCTQGSGDLWESTRTIYMSGLSSNFIVNFRFLCRHSLATANRQARNRIYTLLRVYLYLRKQYVMEISHNMCGTWSHKKYQKRPYFQRSDSPRLDPCSFLISIFSVFFFLISYLVCLFILKHNHNDYVLK